MKLNEKDLELIAKIDERLKHYKLITDNEQPITEQKQRWKPICIEEVYWFIAPDLTVLWFEYLGNEMDKSLILVGNCFKTQEEAEQAAQEIRKTLENL